MLRKLRQVDYKSPRFIVLAAIWAIGTVVLAFVFDHVEGTATEISNMSESEVEMSTSLRGQKPGYSFQRVGIYTLFSSFALYVVLSVFNRMTTRSKYDQDY